LANQTIGLKPINWFKGPLMGRFTFLPPRFYLRIGSKLGLVRKALLGVKPPSQELNWRVFYFGWLVGHFQGRPSFSFPWR